MSAIPEEPGYESGRTLLLAITAIVGVMIILALALAWIDSRMLNKIGDYEAAGLTDLPADGATPEELLRFATEQGLNCATVPELISGMGECRTVLDIAKTVNDYKSNQSLVWGLLFFVAIGLIVAFTMFIHRSSSNLHHLRITGQKFSPGWAVGWFFVPVMNLFQPTRVVKELVKASGSTDTRNSRAWQNASPPDAIMISSWWTLVILSIVFGPRGISLFVSRDDIDGWAAAGRLLVASDLFQLLPLVLTVVVVYRLQRAQEIRNQLVLSRESRTPKNP